MGRREDKGDHVDQRAPGETLDIGLDISTSVTGISVLKRDGSLVALRALKLGPQYPTLWEKADAAEEELKNLRIQLDALLGKDVAIGRIFVEENAKRFATGMTSADTILTLAKFNGIVCYIAQKMFRCPVIETNVISARSRCGIKVKGKNQKEQVLAYNLAAHPDWPWVTHVVKGEVIFNACNKDLSDAYVIARGSQIIHAGS